MFARRNRSRAYLDQFEAVVWWREDGVRYGCHLGIGWDTCCGDDADLPILADAAWYCAQEIAEYIDCGHKETPRAE